MTRRPNFLNTIAVLSLITGIFDLLGAFPFLLLGGLSTLGPVFFIGLINLVIGILMVALFFGLRKMKKWALYLFILSTVLALLVLSYGLITDFWHQKTANIIAQVIQIALVIYFWRYNKEFT